MHQINTYTVQSLDTISLMPLTKYMHACAPHSLVVKYWIASKGVAH